MRFVRKHLSGKGDPTGAPPVAHRAGKGAGGAQPGGLRLRTASVRHPGGQKLEIVNSDPTLHNVNCQPKANKKFNIAQPVKGMKTAKTFDQPEIGISFKCNVHPWMVAYAGVFNHPFYAVTDESGAFSIQGLPGGTYTIGDAGRGRVEGDFPQLLMFLPESASTIGPKVDQLYWAIVWITGFFFFLVQGGLLLFVLKYRFRPGRKAGYGHGNTAL